jgi:hypothetical protein
VGTLPVVPAPFFVQRTCLPFFILAKISICTSLKYALPTSEINVSCKNKLKVQKASEVQKIRYLFK